MINQLLNEAGSSLLLLLLQDAGCSSRVVNHLCHKKRTEMTDILPFPVQVESEQRGTRPESSASEPSESDLFSGSAKTEKRDISGLYTLTRVLILHHCK